MIKKLQQKLSKDTNLKELLSGSVITFALKIIGIVFNYFVMFLISSRYGAEGIGVFGVTYNTLSFLSIIGTLGMNVSVLRYIGQLNSIQANSAMMSLFKHATLLITPWSIILSFILFLLSEHISTDIFGNLEYNKALKFAAFILPFFTLNLLYVEFLRGLKKLKISEYLRSVSRFLIIVIIISASLINSGSLDAVYSLGIGVIITFIFTIYYLLRIFSRLKFYKGKQNNFCAKEFRLTSYPMLFTAVATFVMGNASIFFLEIFSTTEEVGIFNVAFKVSQIIILILLVVNTVSAPKFSEMFWNDKIDDLRLYLVQSSKMIFIIALSISIILILFSKNILLLFGDEFISGQIVLIILIIGQLVNAISGSVGVFMNMTGNQKAYRNIILTVMFFTLGINFLLVKDFGMIGAAISTSFGVIIVNILSVWYVQAKVGFKTYYLPFSLNNKHKNAR